MAVAKARFRAAAQSQQAWAGTVSRERKEFGRRLARAECRLAIETARANEWRAKARALKRELRERAKAMNGKAPR